MRRWLILLGWILLNHEWEATFDHAQEACEFLEVRHTLWECYWSASRIGYSTPGYSRELARVFTAPDWDPVTEPIASAWLRSVEDDAYPAPPESFSDTDDRRN